MNTSEAATAANVTVATVRAWCRIGAVAATKTNGRWSIDPDSLAHRIALPALLRAPRPLDADAMIALGGSRWTKNGMDRIYLNDWTQYAGIEIARYNTGNISSASIDGRGIANGRIGAIVGTVEKVYFDCADRRLYIKHHGAKSIDVRYLDGQRATLDLFQRICDGIKAAASL